MNPIPRAYISGWSAMLSRLLATIVAVTAALAAGASHSGISRADVDTGVPGPTGPHQVGRTDTVIAAGGRMIGLSIWYPSTESGTAPYIPASSPLVRAQLALQAAWWLRTPAAAPSMATSTLPIAQDAPAAGDTRTLPVVVWSPGIGTPRWLGSGWAMDMASHGMVVIAVDHSDSPAMEVAGHVQRGTPPQTTSSSYMRTALGSRVDDLRAVLDRLPALPVIGNKIDPTRIAVAGHSYGGLTAVTTAASDHRIGSVLVLDGSAAWDEVSEPPNLAQPTLLLASGDMLHASWLALDATVATIIGAGHYTATDLPSFGCPTDTCGTIPSAEGAAITRAVSHAWLARQLQGTSTEMPTRPALVWRRVNGS